MSDLKTAAEVSSKLSPGVVCPECGNLFNRNRPQQEFCSTAHAKSFQNRQLTEGRAVVALLKAWRASRNKKENGPLGAQCLSEVCTILDSFNAADREAGRPNAIVYGKRLLSSGRYIDRARR